MDIYSIRKLVNDSKIVWQTHCLMRMQERDISRNDVIKVLNNGEIIEEYIDDYPHPSCLILGSTENKSLHVVIGNDDETIYVITAYVPNTKIFNCDLKTRREK